MSRIMGNTRWGEEKKGHLDYANDFREKGYLLIRGLLPAVMLDYLKVYYRVLRANNRFHRDSQCPSSLALGGDPALDAVLEWIRPEIARLVGTELAPTYSYTRIYSKGEVLDRHVDRPACEISVTVAIEIPKGGGPSVLCVKPPKTKASRVAMFEGDACVYAGTKVEHWRTPFRRGGYTQLFLHFISKRGEHFPTLVFDGRKALGVAE
jgi:hypothetical protein